MVTHVIKKKVYASLRRVWRTPREKDEDMATKADMPKERRRNFNYMQAFNDIFCRSDDEDEDVELQRKKYSEGVWVEDNCEDSKRICANILSLATGETSNVNNRALEARWSGFPH